MRRLVLILPLLSLFAVGCSTVPITGRRQLALVPDKEILALSQTEYRSFMGKAKVSGDKTQSAQVTRVGRKIANATDSYLRSNGHEKEAENFSWEFNLVQEKEVNAFCMPGGKIVVYTGLMPLIASDDELAVVLGHEVAHAVAKHGSERMSQQLLAAAGATAAAIAIGGDDSTTQAAAAAVFGLGAEVGVMLPFSRKHESEADYMGLILMTLAGYNPDAAIPFWEKMAAQGGSSRPAILSSHPSDKKRIAALKKALPEVKTKYGR